MTVSPTAEPPAGEARIVTARRIVSLAAPGPASGPVPGPKAEPEALACQGERVVATGTVAELRARFPGAQLSDLGDVTIVPGFNDAHQHPTVCAEHSLHVDLSPERVHSRAGVLEALRQRAARTPDGEWVVAAGLDPARTLGGADPARPNPASADLTRADLDEACPRHPVLVVHMTLHSGVLNSHGLSLAGLPDGSADPPGGELGRDAAGRLTGLLIDQALYDVAFPAFTRRRTVVPPPGPAESERAFGEFAERLLAAGITSVGDAMVGPEGWELLSRLDRRGALPLRVNALVAYEHFGHFRKLDLPVPAPEDRLRVGGVKAFADGAVNGGACWVTEPVIGAEGHGLPRMPPDELASVVREVHDAGWRVAVHANGDRAIGVTLDAITQAQRAAAPRPDPRHRIEHVAIVNDGIVAAMRALGTVAVPFGQYPAAHGDKLRKYYEPERTERMFAHRALLDAEIPVAGSSDYPCGPLEPLYAMRSCVTRADRNGRPFGPSQRISARRALELYTTGSAYASAEEAWKGRLAPGFLADFTVLGGDPLTVSGDRLTEIPVLQTWLGGHPAWTAPGYAG